MAGTPLYEREKEIATLARLVEDVGAGGSAAVLVEGPVGIGKTRLLRAAVRRAATAGIAIGCADSHSTRGGDAGNMFPLLTALTAGPEPVLGPAAGGAPSNPVAYKLWLLEWIGEALAQRARSGPVLVVLDDLHVADPLTLFALPALVGELGTSPIGWLFARQLSPSTRVQQAMNALSAAGATALEVPPLGPDGIAALAADVLNADPGEALLRRLRGAAGNPLVALEFLRLNRSSSEAAARACTLPPRLVERMLCPVPEPARWALALAAALGPRFTSSELAEIGGYEPAHAERHLTDLCQVSLLECAGPWLSFRHALLREALMAHVPPRIGAAAEAFVLRRQEGHRDSGPRPADTGVGWRSLTAAEERIARFVAEGMTNREIAQRLTLSPHTVDYHLKHVFSKLRVRSRVHLARIVLAHESKSDSAVETA